MSSAALSVLFNLDQDQSPKSSSDPPLSNLAIVSTPMEDRLRTRAESQPDDNCPRLNRTSIIAPAFSSDAPNLGNSPRESEASVIPPIQPNPQGQVQHALGASLEKEEEVETIRHIQQFNPYDDFNTAGIHILCGPGGNRRYARAILDTGSDCSMISDITVNDLDMSDHIQVQDKKAAIPIMTLSGDEVTPNGKIELSFYGEGMNRCIYVETFQVIDRDVPWQIIIGKDFLQKRGIYKRFGLVGVHPPKTEAELREAPDRRQKYEAEKAENARLVREQERKERASYPSAQTQRNDIASHPSQNQDRS